MVEFIDILISWLAVCILYSCRRGDDTQRGLNAEPPLESPDAASQT